MVRPCPMHPSPRVNRLYYISKVTAEDNSDDENILNRQQLLDAELYQSSVFSEDSFEDMDVDFVGKSPEEGDFVLLGIDPVKGIKVKYVGKLLSDRDDENKFQFSFSRKSTKRAENCFFFSNVNEATVQREPVIRVLPKPILQSIK